jgi:outer membrane protein assembly factor BamB
VRSRTVCALFGVRLLATIAILSGASCNTDSAIRPGGEAARVIKTWFVLVTPTSTGGDRLTGPYGWLGKPAIGANEMVVVGIPGGVAGYSSQTGESLWSTRIPEGGSPQATVAADDREACIADLSVIGCVDVRDGHLLWTAKPESTAVWGETAIDRGTWYVGTTDHLVTAYDEITGAKRWVVDIAPSSTFSTRIYGTVVAGDTVYATTVRWLNSNGFEKVGDIVALDRQSGRILWHYTSPSKGGFQGEPVIGDRNLVVNDPYANSLVALDRFSGAEIWRTPKDSSGYVASESPPSPLGDTLFAASSDGQLYALDLKSGGRFWRVTAGRESLGGAAVCGRYVLVYPFAGGQLLAVDRRSHSVNGVQGLESDDAVTSRITVKENHAYFASENGLYRFDCQ